MNSGPSSIFDGIVRSVRRTPTAVALRFREREWSYAELLSATHAMAEELARLGVRQGARVAFFSRNSDAYVIGWLATQSIGAVHVPINFMLGASELAYILDHSAPQVLCASAELHGIAKTALDQIAPTMRLIDLDDLGQAAMSTSSDYQPNVDVPSPPSAEQVAQIAYTSGTEAKPKGAVLTDAALMHQYMSCVVAGEYTSDDVVLHALPLYHCAQLHCFLTPFLLLGARNILIENPAPAQVIEAIRLHKATSFFAPPTVWNGILRDPACDPMALVSLQKGYYGASAMPAEILRALRERLPWLRLWNYYGQTEIGPLATSLGPEDHKTRPSSVGRPVLFVASRVVDEGMNDVPPGVVGELVHRSPQLLREYYGNEIRTKEAFSGEWFHTGDLAKIDTEGCFYIVDRKKDMINTGGENVSSREVEEVIYGHSGVAEVAVIGISDPKWVERVCAFVVPRDGEVLDAADIIDWTSRSLAGYKRPKKVYFIESLPKGPSGKTLKRVLRDSAIAQASL